MSQTIKVHTTLRVLREKANIRQEDLARMLGRAQPEISMWEWGKEVMPTHIRYQITGVLRARLGVYVEHLRATDLDRPWDEILLAWNARAKGEA